MFLDRLSEKSAGRRAEDYQIDRVPRAASRQGSQSKM